MKKSLFLPLQLPSILLVSPMALVSCIAPQSPNKNKNNDIDNENPTQSKEYFSNLQPDLGIDKLPYKFSNILKSNYATEININYLADGDTFQDAKGNKYRFAGIDTPETRKNDNGLWAPTSGLQYKYGKLATNFTNYYAIDGLLPKNNQYKNRPTKIFIVPQKTKKGKTNISDKYGRIVVIVYYQDENGKFHCLNEKLIKEGLARMHYISLNKNSIYYTENLPYYKILETASKFAKSHNLGFWKEKGKFNEIFPY